MNSYHRYMGMVKGQKVDYVPRIPILMHFAADHINASYADFARNYKTMCQANIALVEDYGFDQLDIMSDPYRETSAWGGQITYHEETTPFCPPPLAKTKDMDSLVVPEIFSSERLKNAIDGIDVYKHYGHKLYSITGWVEGPAAEAANVRGVETFLMDMMLDEAFACSLMDRCLGLAIPFAKAQIEHGCDTIGVGDAIASQVGPDLYERLILPRQKKLVDAIHEAGGLIRMHICGDITPLLPGLSTLGLDIIDIDWQVDILNARNLLSKQVALGGNLNPVEDVMRSNPAKIREDLINIYDKIDNPFFVNAGCEIPRGTPVENLRALCDPIEYR